MLKKIHNGFLYQWSVRLMAPAACSLNDRVISRVVSNSKLEHA